MENMRYITFFRQNNDFTDIIADPTIKKAIDEKISFLNHLILGITDDDKIFSYITLKYGDNIVTNNIKDYRPIPHVDYTPIRR
jgi:predicted nucleic acid-binding protein